MNVYGISGLKNHGKDTLARFIQREREKLGTLPSFHVTHFAYELKRLCQVVFGLTEAQVYDQDLKEVPLPEPIEMDKYLTRMGEETGLHIRHACKFAKSPREVMQYFGTEYVRKTQDNYWLDCVLKVVAEKGDFVLVPDTRYQNEVDALRSIGGKVIKVKRLGLPEGVDGHSSETEMAKIEPDLLLVTVTDNFSLQEEVAKRLAVGDFAAAQQYDFRNRTKATGKLAEFFQNYYYLAA